MSENVIKRDSLFKRIFSSFSNLKKGFADNDNDEIRDMDLKNKDQAKFQDCLNEVDEKIERIERANEFNKKYKNISSAELVSDNKEIVDKNMNSIETGREREN